MAVNLQVNILGDYDKLTKATRGAQKQLTNFEKSSKAVSKGVTRAFLKVGAAFGAMKIAGFLIDSAKAAGEDQRAQKLLATTMQRVAGAKQADITSTEKLIQGMETASGVADDFLRPAMSKLVSTTKNTQKAQTLLKIALGASAKSGKPLEKVTNAISKAYLGNTKTLEKMFPELVGSKNALKDLADVSKGMAASNADPFQKMQVGLDNFKEVIGGPIAKQLADFVAALFSPQNAKPMQTFQDAVSKLGSAVGTVFGAFDKKGNSAGGFLDVMTKAADGLATSLEMVAFYINTIQNKPINYKLYPHIAAFGIDNPALSSGGTATDPHKKIAQNGPLRLLVGGKPAVPTPSAGAAPRPTNVNNTYNITSQTTDKMTAQQIIRMIQDYEKRTGRKYIGPTR